MSSEKDIQRALRWNKDNPQRHKIAVKKCSERLYRESWQFNLYNYNFPDSVEIIDYHRCRFNGISYHVGLSGYLIANKDIGKGSDGKRKYEAHKLHRDLFMYYNNVVTIPKDYQIHHKDNDVTNNTLSNLVLVHKNEHKRLHGKKVRA